MIFKIRDTGVATFDCHSKRMEILGRDGHCLEPTMWLLFFRNSQRRSLLCSVALSKHGQAFRIIIWQPPLRTLTLCTTRVRSQLLCSLKPWEPSSASSLRDTEFVHLMQVYGAIVPFSGFNYTVCERHFALVPLAMKGCFFVAAIEW